VAALKAKWEAGTASPVRTPSPTSPHAHPVFQNDTVSKYMTKFDRRVSKTYTLITPLTPLAELAAFLQGNIFALGARGVGVLFFGAFLTSVVVVQSQTMAGISCLLWRHRRIWT